jgi:hypothetical protein
VGIFNVNQFEVVYWTFGITSFMVNHFSGYCSPPFGVLGVKLNLFIGEALASFGTMHKTCIAHMMHCTLWDLLMKMCSCLDYE